MLLNSKFKRMLLKNHINHSPRLLIKLIPLVDHTKITVIIIYDSEDLASMAPLLRIVSSVNHFQRSSGADSFNSCCWVTTWLVLMKTATPFFIGLLCVNLWTIVKVSPFVIRFVVTIMFLIICTQKYITMCSEAEDLMKHEQIDNDAVYGRMFVISNWSAHHLSSNSS